MDTSRAGRPPAPAGTTGAARTPAVSAAQLAKGAWRRLAQAQHEPTPENYARAYAEEAGLPPPAASPPVTPVTPAVATVAGPCDNSTGPDPKALAADWAALAERLARNLDRGGRQWTMARRKDSLQRLFDGNRSDAARLLKRMQSLLGAWESDTPADKADTGIDSQPAEGLPAAELGMPGVAPTDAGSPADSAGPCWQPVVSALESAVRAGLPPDDTRACAIASQLGRLARRVAEHGAQPELAAQIASLCDQAGRLFGHRHHLVEQLGALCQELSAGLVDLAEDDSWARGQCQGLQARLADGISVRSVRAASALLSDTRERQHTVRAERQQARAALTQSIHAMLVEVGTLGDQTGRFQQVTLQHAAAIAQAGSLEGLAGVVKLMLEDTRDVHAAVGQTRQRLLADQSHALALEDKVRALESELKRLSEEVSTDALTQVANRRGLMQAFEAESAHAARLDAAHKAGAAAGAGLAVGLIDIDNFKRLNDTLGHAAGDVALKTLAGAIRERLRPNDHLARFGGEEFVVLLPTTALDEAQQVLTRLQRSLTEALFLHDGREVFVTFSAGVTCWRPGEALQSSLERADEALYEAKRSGKNRTCLG